jgi:hypothetical protein
MREIRQGFTNCHDKKHQMDLWDKWGNRLKHQVHISCLLTYDLYSPIRNSFDAGKSIIHVTERSKNRDIFWAQMAPASLLAISGRTIFILCIQTFSLRKKLKKIRVTNLNTRYISTGKLSALV